MSYYGRTRVTEAKDGHTQASQGGGREALAQEQAPRVAHVGGCLALVCEKMGAKRITGSYNGEPGLLLPPQRQRMSHRRGPAGRMHQTPSTMDCSVFAVLPSLCALLHPVVVTRRMLHHQQRMVQGAPRTCAFPVSDPYSISRRGGRGVPIGAQ